MKIRPRRRRPLSLLGGLVRMNRNRWGKPSSWTFGGALASWNSRRRTWRGHIGPAEWETDGE